MIEYPCKDCIVKLQCVSPCIRLENDEEMLFKYLKHYKLCPDCGFNMFNKYYNREVLIIKCLGCLREFTPALKVLNTMINSKSTRMILMRFTNQKYQINAMEYYGTEVVDEIRGMFT